LNHAEAVALWDEVVRLPRANGGDREESAAALLQAGALPAAGRAIDELLKQNPGTNSLVLASCYSERIGNRAKALEYARIAVKRAPQDEIAQARLAEVLAASLRADERTEAREILWAVAAKNGGFRKSAIESLARAPDLTPNEQTKILDQLSTVAPFTVTDALLAADLRLKMQPEDAAAVYDEIIASWGGKAKLEVAQWLNGNQQFDRVLSLVDSRERRDQLLLARLDALAAKQRWDEIDTTLSRKDPTFDPVVEEAFRARLAPARHLSPDAEEHWNKALTLAGNDVSKLHWLGSFAEQSGADEIALRTFQRIARSPGGATFALAGQQRLAAKMHDISAARTIAEKTLALHPADPNAQNRVVYYNLLLEKDVSANATKAKELVAKYPDRLEFRVTAALALLRQHDPVSALAQFQGPPIEWAKTPPWWRAVYVGALRGNQREDAAHEIIAAIPMDKLSSEERALIDAK
jgi:tetratricopeptide (TPR) repeat protein